MDFDRVTVQAFAGCLDALDAGGVVVRVVDGHAFMAIRTGELALHSSRPRFLVACATCEELLHEATTGPIPNIERHLKESTTSAAHDERRILESYGRPTAVPRHHVTSPAREDTLRARVEDILDQSDDNALENRTTIRALREIASAVDAIVGKP